MPAASDDDDAIVVEHLSNERWTILRPRRPDVSARFALLKGHEAPPWSLAGFER